MFLWFVMLQVPLFNKQGEPLRIDCSASQDEDSQEGVWDEKEDIQGIQGEEGEEEEGQEGGQEVATCKICKITTKDMAMHKCRCHHAEW